VARIASHDLKTGKSDGLVHCSVKNAVCAKTIMKESRKLELARLKKNKKKEKHLGRLVTVWFGTFTMLFSATGGFYCHENTQK